MLKTLCMEHNNCSMQKTRNINRSHQIKFHKVDLSRDLFRK